jgi:hypothetical protein
MHQMVWNAAQWDVAIETSAGRCAYSIMKITYRVAAEV